MANGCSAGRAAAEQVHLVAGRQPHVEPDGDAAASRLLECRALQAHHDVAEAARAADRGEEPPVADVAVRLPEEVRQRVGRAEPLDRARRRRPSDRVDTIGTASETSKRSVTPTVTNVVDWLTLASIALTRRHDVLAAAEQLRVVVGEDGRHALQVEPFDGVEREALEREADRHAAGADRLGAIGEDRPEALRVRWNTPSAGVELVGEAAAPATAAAR